MSILKSNTITLENLLAKAATLPKAVIVDTTLTKSGQAADAKIVGDTFTNTLKQSDRQNIVNDALAAMAGADPSDAAYAELKNRTAILETKSKNIAEDIATLQNEVDETELFLIKMAAAVIAPAINPLLTVAYSNCYYNSSSKVWSNHANFLSNKVPFIFTEDLLIQAREEYQFAVAFWASEDTTTGYIRTTGYMQQIKIPKNQYFTLTIKRTDGLAISTEEDVGVYVDLPKTRSQKYKTVSILGDSYSTFKDFTTPITNSQYYPPSDSTTQGSNNDVENIQETWWSLFSKEYDIIINQNNSFSGSPISYDGYGDGTQDAKNYSFVTRCKDLLGADLIIVEGGTNDSSAGVSMGSYKTSGWVESDFSQFRPSLAYVLWYLTNKYPSSTVIFMLNNSLSADVNASVETLCSYYNVPLLKLSNINKQNYHPSVQGMVEIKDQLITFLNNLS